MKSSISRIGDVSGGGKLAGDMREIWSCSRALCAGGQHNFGMVDQPRFARRLTLCARCSTSARLKKYWPTAVARVQYGRRDNLRQDLVDQVREEQQNASAHLCASRVDLSTGCGHFGPRQCCVNRWSIACEL